MIVSLGVDPGSVNYAYGCVQFKLRHDSLFPKILSAGQLHWTIINLTETAVKPPKSKRKKSIPIKEQLIPPFSKQLTLFEKDWRAQIRRYQPDIWTVERFQARGLKGKTVECVSLMNGVLAAMARRNKISYTMITAAQWKNRVNAFDNLDKIYTEVSLPPHIVDAVFISTYRALQHYDLKWNGGIINRVVEELMSIEYRK